ncbi:hypothetical protein [Pseudomonas lundensis]|uniref:hypothetical protein n=1 Tax=Pseudomonas lundensis TaxID=86185 RepID=UPI0014767DF3|nr:hypothetical protein [Pseudomonas lundensis]NNA32568.1 hypothetical protein [Pseudomonas lundensis]NNA41896.1 hypothetical protein [Pseudomonas lundensis]
MQIAILLVLVVIAVILAPWLLGVAAIAVAAYGLWVAVGMVIAAVVFVLVIGVMMFSSRSQPSSGRTEQMIAEVNQKHREKEAAEQAAARENIALEQAEVETIKKARVMECPHCSASIAKHSLYCALCGKNTKGLTP